MNQETTENNEKLIGGITGKGFVKGDPRINREGKKPDTPEDKIIKKATKQLIEEYKEALGESLELIKPVLIEKAVKGDVQAIKEIHDRVMDKAKQPTDLKLSGDITVNVVRYNETETE